MFKTATINMLWENPITEQNVISGGFIKNHEKRRNSFKRYEFDFQSFSNR